MKVLVTGGAGYVGSVVTEDLLKAGHEVVVLDNLSQGSREAVHPDAAFIQGDLRDVRSVGFAFLSHPGVEAVMHFASEPLVGYSMHRPELYLRDNVTNGVNLLTSSAVHGARKFVLSSTANVYGSPKRVPIDEDEVVDPGSPHGESTYTLERALRWYERIYGLRFGVIRSFNAAGATARLGEHHDPETHIVPFVLDVALGRRSHFTLHGDDYLTRDGTCIRDYVHVSDLATAYVLTLECLDQGSRIYNVGNGRGYSNLEVIEAARKVTGRSIPRTVAPRRPGDPDVLIASSDRIRAELGWRPRYPDLESIVSTAWEWWRSHPNGYDEVA